MKARVFIFFVVFMCTVLQVYASSNDGLKVSEVQTKPMANPHGQMMGGWAPVFFTHYDGEQVSNIIRLLKNKKVSSISITYTPEVESLALRINETIYSATGTIINMSKLQPQDSKDVQYNHHQVVVTLFFNRTLNNQVIKSNRY